MPIGVPAPFDPAIADQVLELSRDGKLWPDIEKVLGLSAKTFQRWARTNPSFGKGLALARDEGLDALADRLPTLPLEHDAHTARVISDNIRWLLMCRSGRYRPAQELKVVTMDLSGDLIEAHKRVPLLPGYSQSVDAIPQITEYTQVVDSAPTDCESGTPVDPFS